MGNFFNPARHDLSIVDPSTNDVLGFVLSRTQSIPYYYEMDSAHLVDLFSSTAPTEVNTNPEQNLVIGQSDWKAGFGQEFYDSSDVRRYHVSSMDLRHKGMAIAGPTSTAIVLPTPHTASAYNNPTTVSDPAGGWTDEANIINGSEANYAYVNPGAAWTEYLYVGVASISCTGIKYYWDEAVDNDVIDLEIDVYYNGAWNAVVTDDSQGEGAAATAALGGTYSVSGARIRMKGAGAGNVLFRYIQFYAVSATIAANPIKGTTFNSLEYIPIGSALYKLNATGDGFTFVKAFHVPITQIQPFQVSATDYLFIFLGTSFAYWYMVVAETFTESNATNKTYQYAAWVNTTVDNIYANDGPNTVRSTTNPLNSGTAWSAQIVVGDAATNITHLQEKDGALLIDKEDMPYYLDSSGDVKKDLAPECKSGKATHSGKNSAVWQGEYFRPTGDQALLRSGTANSWIQPSQYGTGISDFAGQVEAVAGDEQYLYVAIDNSTKVEILCFRDETIDGTVRQTWHPFHELTLTGVNTMWISTVYKKRLWISSTTASESLYYIDLPTKYGDVVNDTNASFLTGTTFETPWLDGGFPTDNKAWVSLTCTMGHAYDANIYFNVNYKLLGDSSWSATTMKFDGSATTMIETNYFEVATTSRTSPKIKLRFTAVTDDTAKTPILYDYRVDGILYPSRNEKIILAKVRVGEGVLDKDGVPTSDNYGVQKTCLENMRSASSWITTSHYLDQTATTNYVKMLTLPQSTDYAWRKPVRWERKRQVEWEYSLLMLVKQLA